MRILFGAANRLHVRGSAVPRAPGSGRQTPISIWAISRPKPLGNFEILCELQPRYGNIFTVCYKVRELDSRVITDQWFLMSSYTRRRNLLEVRDSGLIPWGDVSRRIVAFFFTHPSTYNRSLDPVLPTTIRMGHHQNSPNFKLGGFSIDENRPIKVVAIGAGYSGMYRIDIDKRARSLIKLIFLGIVAGIRYAGVRLKWGK